MLIFYISLNKHDSYEVSFYQTIGCPWDKKIFEKCSQLPGTLKDKNLFWYLSLSRAKALWVLNKH